LSRPDETVRRNDGDKSSYTKAATSRRTPNFSRPLLKEPLYEFHFHVIPRLALELFVLLLHAQITVSRLIIFWRARNAAV